MVSGDLTEAEHIKKRWQDYTEKIQKGLNDWDNHSGDVTDLESDILECEVKWPLGSNTISKVSESDGIPAQLFQILTDDAVNVLHSICQQIWKIQKLPQNWNGSVFIPYQHQCNFNFFRHFFSFYQSNGLEIIPLVFYSVFL